MRPGDKAIAIAVNGYIMCIASYNHVFLSMDWKGSACLASYGDKLLGVLKK